KVAARPEATCRSVRHIPLFDLDRSIVVDPSRIEWSLPSARLRARREKPEPSPACRSLPRIQTKLHLLLERGSALRSDQPIVLLRHRSGFECASTHQISQALTAALVRSALAEIQSLEFLTEHQQPAWHRRKTPRRRDLHPTESAPPTDLVDAEETYSTPSRF